MKTKIELDDIPKMTIKEFQALAQREFKRLANANIDTEIVVLTDFLFSCGNVGSVVLPGSGSDLNNYYKAQKKRAEKDYAQGTCTFKDGKIQINLLDGPAKATALIQGLKKVKIGFDTVITKNAPAETPTTEKAEPQKEKADVSTTKPAETKAPPAVAAVPNEQLASGLDKVKMGFQKMRDIMPRAIAGTTTPEDLQAFAQLQQQIQQWFAIFTATPAPEQAAFKEQAVKLKEQYSKIAAIVQKNKPK